MNSEELFKISKNIIPGGVNSPVRAFEPYPFFVKEAKGSHIVDIDGNDYIDYCLAYGPILLGHSDDDVMKDVYEQMQRGTAYGAPTENEVKLAEEVIDRVPCAEMVRFVNSGTEATMAAIRLARGFTGKSKIVKFEGAYHGAHDYVLVKSGSGAACLPDSAGIPVETTQNTLSVPFNNVDALTKLIEDEGEDIACVIVEPVMGNIGCVEPTVKFLKFLREITEENGIVLIFDEVITGFRVSRGGAQSYYGVKPDLVTFAKVLGGGFPIGAYAGKKEIMSLIAPNGPVYQAGTFSGNPISIQAGLSTLKKLDYPFYGEMSQKGDFLRESISDILEDLKLELQGVGLSSMFQIYFNEEPVIDYETAKRSDAKRFLVYFRELLKNGVFIPPSQFECNFISGAHTDDDLIKTSEAIEQALKVAWKI
ncbi:glutamate-1-semialdehyde 2,1-aminomutase [Methanobrevibacter sp.]|uniref:glutamate-1-semialdehyde 2,1-aminomutase n=1 Tax=Methanobrevibacter sp. TaxID=66852 RepID=UPI0025CBFDD0|nr:glutamate-1-semialdehyde 2,1-aminomutase [Methanobrevibacter sp.]MBQ2961988.1 glutamate-1-semialdehyde 2,1-aminomutase [Methanobrevibacter sp.]